MYFGRLLGVKEVGRSWCPEEYVGGVLLKMRSIGSDNEGGIMLIFYSIGVYIKNAAYVHNVYTTYGQVQQSIKTMNCSMVGVLYEVKL